MVWKEQNNKLVNEFKFDDFKQALAFTNKVGEIAEKHQHHPDIYIHSYNQVKISLTTHDESNQVTEKDYNLSKEIDKI